MATTAAEMILAAFFIRNVVFSIIYIRYILLLQNNVISQYLYATILFI